MPSPVRHEVPTAAFAAKKLAALSCVPGLRFEVPATLPARAGVDCPLLELAASGALWLTGYPDGPPTPMHDPVMAHLDALGAAIAELSATIGQRVEVDPGRVLTERAAVRGFRRGGQISANGCCRLLRATDGWVAVALARESDHALVPAVTGFCDLEAWEAIAQAATRLTADELAGRAQLVGVPAAALCSTRTGEAPPLRCERVGAPSQSWTSSRPVVVDFSAMWAGPLCAHILGAGGAAVIKVEDPDRPDGARLGDPTLFARLHAGHEMASLRFGTTAGRRALHELVASADVVVEASRPRALGQLGFSPRQFLTARPGRTWVSITGYGRTGDRANDVAFGDDAAVAGGLVAWATPEGPVFFADAVADPISGLYGAFGGLGSMVAGGGFLVDVSMSDASAFVRQGPRCAGHHALGTGTSGRWWVSHDEVHQPVVPPGPP